MKRSLVTAGGASSATSLPEFVPHRALAGHTHADDLPQAAGLSFGRVPQLFAIGRTGSRPNKGVPHTQCVTLPERRDAVAVVDVYAAVPERLLRVYDAGTDRAIYLLGRAAHGDVAGPALLQRAAAAHAAGDIGFLRSIVGLFVLVIDDRRHGRVTFLTDALGVRPWFVATHAGRLAAGTDVLPLCGAGLTDRQVDYDALASWLLFNQPLADATILAGCRGLPVGVAASYAADGRPAGTLDFGRLTYADEPITPDELAERQYAAATGVIDTLLHDVSEVSVPLSGGYDSRLLAGLITQRVGVQSHLTTLATRDYETALARDVAAALGRPLEVMPGRPRIVDFFDEPFAMTPAGFACGMNLTNALVRRRPGMPWACGLFGDGTMRGSMIPTSGYFAQEKAGLPSDALVDSVVARFTLPDHRLNLLHPRVRQGVLGRARERVVRVVAEGQATGKPLIHADLFARHRIYFAGNVLQPLAWAEPVVPLAAWALADLRTRHPQSAFGRGTYPALFRRFLPRLAEIPHAYDHSNHASGLKNPRGPLSRHARRLGAELAGAALAGRLRGVVPLKSVGRISVDAFRRRPAEEKELMFLYKLQWLEKRLGQNGVSIDWTKLSQ